MNKGIRLEQRMRAAARAVARTAAGALACVVASLLWSWAASTLEQPDGGHAPVPMQAGWGGEALADVGAAMRAVSPIAEANACGAGASSCFKCHNGTRAAAPGARKWHADHKSVDNSCVGCHKGNARLIKKELAHAEIVKDPRSNAAQACAGCHKAGGSVDVAKAYRN